MNETYEDTLAHTPDLVIDAAGTRHVVWSDDRSSEKLFSIFLAQLDSSSQRLVEGDFEANILYEETNAIDPALAVRNDGEAIVCWTDDRSFLMDLFVRRIHWTGNGIDTLGQEDVLVNIPRENTNVSSPDVVMTDQRTVIVVWSDDRALVDGNQRNDVYSVFFGYDTQADAEGAFPESITRVQLSNFDQILDHATVPKVAFANNRVVVVWRNFNPATGISSIHGAVTDELGDVVQGEFIIDGGASDTQSAAPDVTSLTGNLFMISWYDEVQQTVSARIFDAGSLLFVTDPTIVDENVDSLHVLSLASDHEQEFFTVWDAVSGQIRDLFGASGRWGNIAQGKKQSIPVSVESMAVKAHVGKLPSVKQLRTEKKIKSLRLSDQSSKKRVKK